MDQYQDLTLENVANGALVELFDHELQKVMRNIDDINTPHNVAREVTLKIKFKPNSDREHCEIEVQASNKLAPIKAVEGSCYISKQGSKYCASTKLQREEEEGMIAGFIGGGQ